MKKQSGTIVFFGSGPVAAKSLRLLTSSFHVEAVITKPRAEHHRGDVPVLDVAKELGIAIYTAKDRQGLDELFEDHRFSSDLAVLVDFGIIVSPQVINYFPLGILNSHFSLLPKWRGADPITFAILNGDDVTGVSLMLLVPAMDEGPLLAQGSFPLPKDITNPLLTDHLINLSYNLLVRTIPSYRSGTIKPYDQDQATTSTYSRRVTKDDGVIDWRKPAVQIERQIRAFIEWPQSHTTLADRNVIITSSVVSQRSGPPGQVVIDNNRLIICCGQSALEILRLKPVGKPEMSAAAFLAGHRKQLLR